MRGGSRKGDRKGREVKIANLSEEDKRKLALLVEIHPEVWNLAHPLHRRPDTHVGAWEEISKTMNYSVEVCKKAWKSLRDGLRYRKTPKKSKGKSGDSGPEDSDAENVEEPDDELLNWPFWDSMQFVATQKSNRRTTSTLESEGLEKETAETGNMTMTESGNVTMTESGNVTMTETASGTVNDTTAVVDLSTPKKERSAGAGPRSNYSYAVARKRARTNDPTEKLASGIADLIQIRKEATMTPKAEPLRYQSMYANLDRMHQQLPAAVVEDLNVQYINLAYEAIKRHQNIVVVDGM